MSAQHTSGPWRITGSKTKYVEASIGNGRVQEVCAVGPTEADDGYGPTQAANARLIAAAPDLLEALQAVLSRIEKSEEWWMDCPDRGGFDAEAIRAAIAKATGNA